MALSIDQSAIAGGSTVSSLAVSPLSSTGSGPIVIASVATSNPSGLITVSSVSDTSGLTWAKRGSTNFNGGLNSSHVGVEVWWAFSAGTLTTDAITFHLSGTADVVVSVCFTVQGFTGGGYSTAPWDIHAGLPAVGSDTANTTPSVSVSTTALNTMILGVAACSGNLGNAVGAGYTVVTSKFQTTGGSDGTCITVQYQVVSSAQTSLTDNMGATEQGWAMVGDALSQTVAGGGGLHQMPSMGFG